MGHFLYPPIGGSGGGISGPTPGGPGSTTDNAIARWDGTDGTAIQNSLATLDDAGNFSTPGLFDGRDVSVDGAALDSHIANMSNPHGVTKAQVGLGNVENAAASTLYIPLTQKGAANGVASLDGGGKVPVAQLPNSIMEFQGNWNATTNTPTLADGSGNIGDVYRVNVAGTQNLGSGSQTFVIGDWVIYDAAGTWQKSHAGADAVLSVNGLAGVVTLTTTNIAEGTSLYFTDERAQDAVGAILTDTSSIDLTYNDAGNTISAVVLPAGVDKNALGGAALTVANGGTGQTSLVNAYNSLADSVTGTPTKGDLLARGTSVAIRRPVGTDGQYMVADSAQASGLNWITPAFLTNPMTSPGDLITGGVAGAPTRLAAGQTSQILAGGTPPAWINPAAAAYIPPVGSVMAYMPGYYTATANGGTWITVIPAANTIAAVKTALSATNFRVMDGTAPNDIASPIYDTAAKFLPDMTGNRFLKGATTAGGTGGNSSNQVTLGVTNLAQHNHGPGTGGTQYQASLALSAAAAPNGHTHALGSSSYAQIGASGAGVQTRRTTDGGGGSQTFSATRIYTATGQAITVTPNTEPGTQLGGSTDANSGTAVTLTGSNLITGTSSDTGSGTAFSILPLYIDTFYIMRIK